MGEWAVGGPGTFAVGGAGGTGVDVVVQPGPQCGHVGMIVVGGAGLVGEGGVEGHALVNVGVAVPDAIAPQPIDWRTVGAAGVGVGEGVAVVEECHAVDREADRAIAGQGFRGRHDRGARDPVEHVGIGRVVGERLRAGGVEVPRTERMVSQAGGPEVDPGVRGGYLLYTRVGGGSLGALTAAPGGDRGAGGPGGV